MNVVCQYFIEMSKIEMKCEPSIAMFVTESS